MIGRSEKGRKKKIGLREKEIRREKKNWGERKGEEMGSQRRRGKRSKTVLRKRYEGRGRR